MYYPQRSKINSIMQNQTTMRDMHTGKLLLLHQQKKIKTPAYAQYSNTVKPYLTNRDYITFFTFSNDSIS